MSCCLFYYHLASQLDPTLFKRVIAFWSSPPKKEERLHTRFGTDPRSKRNKTTESMPAAPVPPQNHSTGLSAPFQLR